MIRELKSENDRLKELLIQAAKTGKPIDLKALGIEVGIGAENMEEYMAQKQKEIEEMEKPWEQKLKE